MGRKEWNRRTEKGKDKIRKKMIALLDRITDIEEDHYKVLDLEESINDNISSLFECDLECPTCTEVDRAMCMLNFRKANIFLMSKVMSYEASFGKYLETFALMIKDIGNDLLKVINDIDDATESEEEKDKKDEKDKDNSVTFYS